MEIFSGITIVCFAASYGVALALELLRFVRRLPLRGVFTVFWTVAGLLAHTLFLLELARSEVGHSGLVFSSWYDWCLLAAWGVGAAYLGLLLRRPQNAVGLFLLPLLLTLIALAVGLADRTPFDRSSAEHVWRGVHAASLLLDTISVTLGFAAGLMYVFQSYRLKHKRPLPQGFRLPPLEWLQRFNREALVISTVCLGVGLLSGVVLNLRLRAGGGSMVAWSDPAIVSSLVLFGWLITVTLFEWLYRPAREGRKIAYLTIASFVFLVLALGFVLAADHGSSGSQQSEETQQEGRAK